MKKRKLTILLLLSVFLFSLGSCTSNKQSTDYVGSAKTKNGRFVKYKKYKPQKQLFAFNKKASPKKTRKKPIEPKQLTAKKETTVVAESTPMNEGLLASNNTNDYQIYLNKNQTDKTNYLAVENESSEEWKSEEIGIGEIKKNKTAKYKTPKKRHKSFGRSQYDWVSITGASAAAVATTSLIFFVTAFSAYLAFFLGLVALVFGIIGLIRVKRHGYKGKGFAIAAIIAGILLILIAPIYLEALSFTGFG